MTPQRQVYITEKKVNQQKILKIVIKMEEKESGRKQDHKAYKTTY